MLDSLVLVIISVFVPIIVYTGFKIYKCVSFKKFLVGLSLALLAIELVRFFCNAAFYEGGETPSADLKFGLIAILCIISLFATFNNSSFSVKALRNIFVLSSLGPINLALFDSNVYVNSLDVNAVCKACYMIECGLTLAIALFYLLDNKVKIGAWNILWATIFILICAGINALTILYWKINTAFDLMWYMAWLTVILSILLIFVLNRIYHCIKEKKLTQKESEIDNSQIENSNH